MVVGAPNRMQNNPERSAACPTSTSRHPSQGWPRPNSRVRTRYGFGTRKRALIIALPLRK